MASGVAGQSFFGMIGASVSLQLMGRVVAWVLFGAAIGRGVALFVPNLRGRAATIGGAIGGGIGAICFAVASGVLGDTSGRMVGATSLGLAIGILLVFVEVAFREAWLDIRYQKGAIRRVSLGRNPVTLGSSEELATIYCRGAAPVALSFRVANGEVLCEDVATGVSRAFEDGHEWSVGVVTASLRAPRPGQRTNQSLRGSENGSGPRAPASGVGMGGQNSVPNPPPVVTAASLLIEWQPRLTRSVIGSSDDVDLAIRDASLAKLHAEIVQSSGRTIVSPLDPTGRVEVSFDGQESSFRRVDGRNAVKDGSAIRLGALSLRAIGSPLRFEFRLPVSSSGISVGGRGTAHVSSPELWGGAPLFFALEDSRLIVTRSLGGVDARVLFGGASSEPRNLEGRSSLKDGSVVTAGPLTIRIEMR